MLSRTGSGLGYIPLARAAGLQPFLSFLKSIGVSVERLATSVRLPIRALGEPEALIPLLNAWQFLDDAARQEQIATLGFAVGSRTTLESLGTFGRVVRQSVTLGQALGTTQQLVTTLSSGCRIRLERQGERVWIHHQLLLPGATGSPQAASYALTLIENLVRLVAGNAWHPSAVRLALDPDPDVADLELFAGASLQFRQPSSAIAVPVALLSRPLPVVQRPAAERNHTVPWLHASAPARDFAGSVRQFLRTQLTDGDPGIKQTAEAAGLSVRTLQRRLFAQGADYSMLLNQIRFERAVELLRHTDLKMVDIAHELDYQDAANFTRAFRRWTGLAPQTYRRRDE